MTTLFTPSSLRAWRVAACAATLGAAALGAAQPGAARADDEDLLGERTGGDTTVYATGRNAFSFPLANLSDTERSRFVVGNSFFRRNWVEAPSSTAARDGLGPHFIARSCGGCHVQDGRGAPPDAVVRKKTASSKRSASPAAAQADSDAQEEPVALLLRLSVPGTGAHGGVVPEPTYGDQFNNAAVQGVRPEGRVTMRWQPLPGRFADGTRYTLMKPVYGFADLGYGPMAKDVMVSPRIAPQLAGVGLLEAIPDAEILKNAADQAARPDAIKGQVNRVWDAFAGDVRIGRFGWKANVATLAHQSAGAFVGDIGITSSKFADESCMPSQADCLAAPRGGHTTGPNSGSPGPRPEIDDTTLSQVVFYQASLAPAARRDVRDPRVLAGQKLFERAQCGACHRPSYVTGRGPFPEMTSDKLAGQMVWPYTDLLLHDMGPDLADGRPDYQANGRQWKTPPLWGIGLIRDVNGHQRLLHDGRARGVLEAILWHGGEADAARRRVQAMSAAERAALVKFVESL
jgi:CxxC motif-containing protein (DUF1111 family)